MVSNLSERKCSWTSFEPLGCSLQHYHIQPQGKHGQVILNLELVDDAWTGSRKLCPVHHADVGNAVWVETGKVHFRMEEPWIVDARWPWEPRTTSNIVAVSACR